MGQLRTRSQGSRPRPPPHLLTFIHMGATQPRDASCLLSLIPAYPRPPGGQTLFSGAPGGTFLLVPPDSFLHPGSFLQAPVSRGAQSVSSPWQVTDGKEQAGFHPSPGDGHAPDLPEKDLAKGPTAHNIRLAQRYPRQGTPHSHPPTTKAITVSAFPGCFTRDDAARAGPPPGLWAEPQQTEDPSGRQAPASAQGLLERLFFKYCELFH